MKFEGTVSEFVVQQLSGALHSGDSSVSVCNKWHSGAYLLETVPSVIAILARYGHDPEHAIVRAVNDTRDNDTVAAIVGAAAGALHGEQALPLRWRNGLLGRTGTDDDRRVQELLELATRRFVN